MIAFLVALATSLVLALPVRSLLRHLDVMDVPEDDRRSHKTPTLRGGGMGFVAIIVVALAWMGRDHHALWAIGAAALFLAVVSFLDDRRPIGIIPRFGSQAVVAAVAAAAYLGSGDLTATRLGIALIGFVCCVGYTNAFNFMDGINGIATLQATIAALATAAVAHRIVPDSGLVTVLLVVGGATVGFLPWNFPAAKMFMGDVGSATLGFAFAAIGLLLVHEAGDRAVVPYALAHAGFLLDTLITFARRVRRGEKVFEGHREHFYQRLNRSGWSHTAVTLLYGGAAAISGAVAVLIADSSIAALVVGTVGVIALWVAVFVFAERRFQLHPA